MVVHLTTSLSRHDHPGRLRLEKRIDKVTRLLDTRIEQLQSEKERLLYGEHRSDHLLDNDDDRNAIRRGLQAAPSTKPYHPIVFAAPVLLAGPASPTPSYSPPTSPLGHQPSSTASWSTAAPPPTWAELDRQHFAEVAAREAVAHETVSLAMWGEANRQRLTERARASRAVALPAAAHAPSVADQASCGGSWRQQLAAEALVGMARTVGTAAAPQHTVQEQSVRAAVQQCSTMDSPAAPNQQPGVPMPFAHAMPMAQHFRLLPAQAQFQPLGPAVAVHYAPEQQQQQQQQYAPQQRYAPPLQYGSYLQQPQQHYQPQQQQPQHYQQHYQPQPQRPQQQQQQQQPAAPPCWKSSSRHFAPNPTPTAYPYGVPQQRLPAAAPCCSVAPQPLLQPPPTAYPYTAPQQRLPAAPPCCGVKLQPLPAASPYIVAAPQPPPTGPPRSSAPQLLTPTASPYSIAPQPPETAYLQRLPAASAWNAPPGALQKKFETLVMCDFTPRRPCELQTSRWISFNTLFRLFQPHAPAEVWLMGPGNLKQLITKWYKNHPVFAGFDVNKWCKRLTNNNTQDGPGCYVFKFCFEYTPTAAAAAI